jgi:hypothetical protein
LADRMRSEEMIRRVRVERNVPHTVKRRKVDWSGHMLSRNCLL